MSESTNDLTARLRAEAEHEPMVPAHLAVEAADALDAERDKALAALNGLDEARAKYGLDGADVAGVVRHLEGNRDFVHGTDAFTIRLLTEQRDEALAREAALRAWIQKHADDGDFVSWVEADARAVLAEEARP